MREITIRVNDYITVTIKAMSYGPSYSHKDYQAVVEAVKSAISRVTVQGKSSM
jgi:hypothetical protein